MSVTFADRLKKYFIPEIETNQSGVYSFRREKGGAITRFHLRIEKNGAGMLLANSSVACRLSPSGALIAKSLLQGENENKIESDIRKNFREVRSEELSQDIERVRQFIETLSIPDDAYPIFNLQDPALETPRSLIAPFHAQMHVGSPETVNPILQKLWDVGIPHVTFEVNNVSSIDDSIRNVQRAEDIGMICGVRAQGSWFQQDDVMKRLALAGIDYIVAPIVSSDKDSHDKLLGAEDFSNTLKCFSDCTQWEICPVAEIAIFNENKKDIPELLGTLKSKNVRNIHCFAVAEPLTEGLNSIGIIQTAVEVLEAASKFETRIIWLPSVRRSTSLEEVVKAGPRTAGDVSIFVDHSGNVYPSRGPKVSAGNLLQIPWNEIWSSGVFRQYRDRVESNTHCSICPGMEICAADCPGDPKGWDTV